MDIEVRHFHLFCGLGGGAKGFNRGEARVGSLRARYRCLGGIDCDPAAIRDFERLAGVPGTVMDLFSREQYVAFHGHEPPVEWREATPEDIRRAAGSLFPHIGFLSAPCKGFSGLLSESKSATEKYQALNGLTLRGIWLTLEAFKDDPMALIVFENVPRIATRGRYLLDQIGSLLRAYGYAVAETAHDCGELGGLAQSRKRFLLVARHTAKVPNFLYEPIKRPLRAVGDVLSRLPMPGLGLGGPMHRMPALQWKTWVRLAFVEAGSDWRSLSKLRVEDGFLADYGIVPVRDWRENTLGVLSWDGPAGTITGNPGPTNGRFSVADPRAAQPMRGDCLGVMGLEESSGTVTSRGYPMNGRFSVADPRMPESRNRHFNLYRITGWDEAAGCITGASHAANGRLSVADPRPNGPIHGKYAVVPFDRPAGTVIAGSTTGQGAYAVADPRVWKDGREHYQGGGHYGVMPWDGPSGAVVGHAKQDRGPWSVADPRLPEPSEKLVAIIRALDGTWHRPFTTLELAALQGLVDPEEQLELDGLSDSAWRERIGNAVPPPAAQTIASVMGTTLLLAMSGETFTMSAMPVWVQPVVAGMMAAQEIQP